MSGRGTRYGIELDVRRAQHATKLLSRVLSAEAQQCRITNGCFGLCFLNPPYDVSTQGRLEVVFLDRAVNWMRPNGVLVFIIKREHYNAAMCQHLARHFNDFHHWRFPDPYYSGPDLAFGQTVLIARRKLKSEADPIAMQKLLADVANLEPLPEWTEPPAEQYRVPAGTAPTLFIPGTLGHDQLAELIRMSTVRRAPRLRNTEQLRPPLPLKSGHKALVLASGAIDGAYGDGPRRHVSKGTVRRTETKTQAISYDGSGRPVVTEKVTQGFEVAVRAITRDGKIHDVAGAKPETSTEAQIAVGDEQEDDE